MSWQPAQGPAACFLLIALLIGLPATANGQQADRETSDTETAAETVTVNGKPMPLPIEVSIASSTTFSILHVPGWFLNRVADHFAGLGARFPTFGTNALSASLRRTS